MKKITISFLCLFFLCSKAQVSGDSLNVTPNPFFKRTCIYYSFTQNDTVSLTVFDQWGWTIYTLKTFSVMPSGNYQDSLLLDWFPDGKYFVYLRLGVRKTLSKVIFKNAAVGVPENTSNFENIAVYPNPVMKEVNINFPNNLDFSSSSINIFDNLGKQVYELKEVTQNQEIVLEFLPTGVYNLQIKNTNSIKVFKIVKQ